MAYVCVPLVQKWIDDYAKLTLRFRYHIEQSASDPASMIF